MRTIFNQQPTQEVTPNGEGFTTLPVSFNSVTARAAGRVVAQGATYRDQAQGNLHLGAGIASSQQTLLAMI
jgi:hypothetical protein